MKKQGLGSLRKILWREKKNLGPHQTWSHGYRGHRRPGRPRVHGENQHGLGHRIAAERRCDALTALAATKSEKAKWPSPGGQR